MTSLADEMNASYSRDENGQIVKAAWPKAIEEYLDTVDGE